MVWHQRGREIRSLQKNASISRLLAFTVNVGAIEEEEALVGLLR